MRAAPEQFDDPGLKAAIRTLEGGHKARPELRDLVTKRLAELRKSEGSAEPSEESPGDVGPAPIRLPNYNHNPFRIGRWLAMAAAVMIVIGGGWGYHHWRLVQE